MATGAGCQRKPNSGQLAETALPRHGQYSSSADTVVSQAPGVRHASHRHRRSAFVNTSCAHSSARSQLPVGRISAATMRPRSLRPGRQPSGYRPPVPAAPAPHRSHRPGGLRSRHRRVHRRGPPRHGRRQPATRRRPFGRGHGPACHRGSEERRISLLAAESDTDPRLIRIALDYAAEHADEVRERIDLNSITAPARNSRRVLP